MSILIKNKFIKLIYLCTLYYMDYSSDILAIALNHPIMQEEMELVHHKVQKIPGTVQYVINRYRKSPSMNFDDTGVMVYNYKPEDQKESNS